MRRCPEQVEAHFWLGASYGPALRLVRRIRREMEASVRLQPECDGGDALLALGEAYLHDGRRSDALPLLRSIVEATETEADDTRWRAFALLRQLEPGVDASLE